MDICLPSPSSPGRFSHKSPTAPESTPLRCRRPESTNQKPPRRKHLQAIAGGCRRLQAVANTCDLYDGVNTWAECRKRPVIDMPRGRGRDAPADPPLLPFAQQGK